MEYTYYILLMKSKNKYGDRTSTEAGDGAKKMHRRTYLKGLGITSVVAGLAASGTSSAAASTTSRGYGEGGYGEVGYGGENGDRAEFVELVIVVENADGEPVEGVDVAIHGDPVTTARTDSDGRVLTELEEGDYAVEATKDGYYREAVIGVEATEGDRAAYRLVLEVNPFLDTASTAREYMSSHHSERSVFTTPLQVSFEKHR